MKLPDLDKTGFLEPAKITIDDIIGDLFHDAQNGVHLVGMELELVCMGLGNSADAVKTADIVKQLENNLRDLRGYISALQEPSATCDLAAILESVVTDLRSRKREDELKITVVIPVSMPLVLAHPKLLARIWERVFEFCENLLQQGGELGIEAVSRNIGGQRYVEVNLTIRSAVAIPTINDEAFCESRPLKNRSNRGLERALEILRRQRGQTSFRRHSDCQCQFTLRMLASSE